MHRQPLAKCALASAISPCVAQLEFHMATLLSICYSSHHTRWGTSYIWIRCWKIDLSSAFRLTAILDSCLKIRPSWWRVLLMVSTDTSHPKALIVPCMWSQSRYGRDRTSHMMCQTTSSGNVQGQPGDFLPLSTEPYLNRLQQAWYIVDMWMLRI
jgi:hypothetical protein